jgi:hypothetical protein
MGKLFQRFAEGFRKGTILPIIEETQRQAKTPTDAAPTAPPVQQSIPVETKRLIDKLLGEKLPADSIARITDLPEALVKAYIQHK